MDTMKLGMLAMLLSMLLVWLATPRVLPILHRLHFGQAIREEGPQSHMKKSGTPTMGGLIIQGGVLLSALVIGFASGAVDFFPLLVMIAFGAIGFIDDFIKVSKKHNLGLRAWQKLVLQFVAAGAVAVYGYLSPAVGSEMYIPFFHIYLDFGLWYIPFTMFAVMAVTNAVNLTDGLDGLASGVTAVVCIFFFAASVMGFGSLSTTIFIGAVMGGCLGFLRFNSNPANIFMGDTGSMALGGAVIVMAMLTKMQLFVLLAGCLYVVEALSVIIQVGYFKLTGGKRFFKMAPIHHHFELKGWSEVRVVTVFWVVTAIFVAIAFLAI
ncbi:MAG: phospho-N-acetylmuramoyl-pentapeptide-transferase [Eubacterium sp.]|nr:phospho-N-acetylmuramoyl-pentapeptide-transferase [Eubacterium sp.]